MVFQRLKRLVVPVLVFALILGGSPASQLGAGISLVASAEAGVVKRGVATFIGVQLVRRLLIASSARVRLQAREKIAELLHHNPELRHQALSMIRQQLANPRNKMHIERNGGNRFLDQEVRPFLDRIRLYERPQASDPGLSANLRQMFRKPPQDSAYGNGSTADGLRNEKLNGGLTGGRAHGDKTQSRITYLQRWLDNNPDASHQDRTTAHNVLRDLRNALNGR